MMKHRLIAFGALLALLGLAGLLFHVRRVPPGDTRNAAETSSAHSAQDGDGAMTAKTPAPTRPRPALPSAPADVPASSPRSLPAHEQVAQEAESPTPERAEDRCPPASAGLDQPTIMTDYRGWTIIAGKVTPMGSNHAALAGGLGLALSNGTWITASEGTATYSKARLDRVSIRGEAEVRMTQETDALRATADNVEVEGLEDGSVLLKADRLTIHSQAKPEANKQKGASP